MRPTQNQLGLRADLVGSGVRLNWAAVARLGVVRSGL